MKRIISIAAFCLTAAAMLFSVGSRIVSNEIRLATGLRLKIRVAAYDPSDILRGRYMALRPLGLSGSALDASALDACAPNARLYGLLSADSDGFSSLRWLYASEPDSGPYLALSCDATGRLEDPFDRFYLNQAEAPRAEDLMRKSKGNDAYVVAFLKDGNLSLRELHIGPRIFRAGKD